MVDKIMTYNTPLAHWYSLVGEAGNIAGTHLTEDLESYLVFLLMRFSTNQQLSHPIALEYLECAQASCNRRYKQLQAVGDKCLLFAGLFPGLAQRRRVQVSYYVNLGQGAYFSLSSMVQNTRSELFESLGNQFVLLVEVLHSAREVNEVDKLITFKEKATLLNFKPPKQFH